MADIKFTIPQRFSESTADVEKVSVEEGGKTFSAAKADVSAPDLTGPEFEGVDTTSIAEVEATERPEFEGVDPRSATEMAVDIKTGAETEGLLTRLGRIIPEKAEKFTESIEAEQAGEQTSAETAGQLVGLSIGAAGEAAFEVAKTVASPITPSKESIDSISKFFDLKRFLAPDNPIRQGIEEGQEGLDKLLSGGVEAFQGLPDRTKRNISALFEIATVVPAAKASKKIIGEVAEEAIEEGVKITKKSLAKTATKEKTDLLQIEGKKVLKEASKEGRVSRGFLGRKVDPSKAEKNIARTLQKVEEEAGESISTNVTKAQQQVGKIRKQRATQLGADLSETGVTVSSKQIDGVFNRIKGILNDNPLLTKASGARESADKLVNKFKKLIDDVKKKHPDGNIPLDELWKTRSEMDSFVLSVKKNIFNSDAAETTIVTAYRDIRTGINQFIDKQAKNVKFTEELRTLHNLFEAGERLAIKEAAMPKNLIDALGKAARNNIAATVLGTTVGISALFNPLALGVLAAGGVFTIGKNIITSESLRKAILKALEAAKTPAGKEALEQFGTFFGIGAAKKAVEELEPPDNQ